MNFLSFLFALSAFTNIAGSEIDQWSEDYHYQKMDNRPKFEVCYTNSKREAFEVIAEKYHLIGELRKPHFLRDYNNREIWLKVSVEGNNGILYSTEFSDEPSRINLYRRGPYYCEVHWFDITVADENGNQAPLKGDLALYCYPEKILGSINWHSVGDFAAQTTKIKGISERILEMKTLKEGETQFLSFPIFGETEPIVGLETIESARPLEYDKIRGCYIIGSVNPGGFEEHFYRHPNFYETVKFKISNDDQSRKIYICHESVKRPGTVEGGILLDEQGNPMPITVQISKNFAGEKEEKFYNPEDTPFSETFFPLLLKPNEERIVTSLHLYQNWGRHCVKQFSSLGAWMDYFHSSTGVTETTCFVPFKFGGLPGVAIADYRAMSQETFWAGQPQHDNVAGHSFLSYNDGSNWQYLVYKGTDYYSTGPNWMDIGLNYLSSDGKIKATIRTFELPQRDQLRNFIKIQYEVLSPIEIKNAPENFRLLTIASWVQRLRYTHFASSSLEEKELSFENNHFDVRGIALDKINSYAALYGENKGSNAFILRKWSGEFSPAAGVWCEKKGDTRLLLTPSEEILKLEKGDVIEFEIMLLPYGEIHGSETCKRESEYYGSNAPAISKIIVGEKLSDFPTKIKAIENRAEFIIKGGKELIPVIITGLKEYKKPMLSLKQENGWYQLRQNMVGDVDGMQTFIDDEGKFGAVFLVASDSNEQHLRFEIDSEESENKRIEVESIADTSKVKIKADFLDQAIIMEFPEKLVLNGENISLIPQWKISEAGSIWFEQNIERRRVGGRLTGNEQDIDIEFWVENRSNEKVAAQAVFGARLSNTVFEDNQLERSFILVNGEWQSIKGAAEPGILNAQLVATLSRDGDHIFAIGWPGQKHLLDKTKSAVSSLVNLADCPTNRRSYIYGKIFIVKGTLNDLYMRFRREIAEK